MTGAHVSTCWKSCPRSIICLWSWVFKAKHQKLLSSICKLFLLCEFIFEPFSTVCNDGTEETIWTTSHKRASEELQTHIEAKSYGIHLHWGTSYRCGGNWTLGLFYNRSYSFTKLYSSKIIFDLWWTLFARHRLIFRFRFLLSLNCLYHRIGYFAPETLGKLSHLFSSSLLIIPQEVGNLILPIKCKVWLWSTPLPPLVTPMTILFHLGLRTEGVGHIAGWQERSQQIDSFIYGSRGCQ